MIAVAAMAVRQLAPTRAVRAPLRAGAEAFRRLCLKTMEGGGMQRRFLVFARALGVIARPISR